MSEEIDKKIEELTAKADSAQMRGDYIAMQEYDRQIRILQDEKFKLFQSIYEEQEEKPKTM